MLASCDLERLETLVQKLRACSSNLIRASVSFWNRSMLVCAASILVPSN